MDTKKSIARNSKFIESALMNRINYSKEQCGDKEVRYTGFLAGFKGAYNCLRFSVNARDWGVEAYSVLPFAIKRGRRKIISELFARINAVVKIGYFDLDFSSGTVRFRMAIPNALIHGDTIISASTIVDLLVNRPCQMMRDWVRAIEKLNSEKCDVEDIFKTTLKKCLRKQ